MVCLKVLHNAVIICPEFHITKVLSTFELKAVLHQLPTSSSHDYDTLVPSIHGGAIPILTTPSRASASSNRVSHIRRSHSSQDDEQNISRFYLQTISYRVTSDREL